MSERHPVPRGRHAPPLEIRRETQRARLFEAAAAVFARVGYSEASAEMISREAGMSKATFYEHFANKEECILSFFDAAASLVLRAMREASEQAGSDPRARLRARIHAFLSALAAHPAEAQTLLVEIVGAGPAAADRRELIIRRFAAAIDAGNAAAAATGDLPRFATPDDALVVAGAVVEIASQRLRAGRAAELTDLEPLVERLILGLLSQPPPAT